MKKEKLNVLSLFDGVGTAYLALQKEGFVIENYYSSEIDKSALAVQNYHYSGDSKFHPIGDVKKIEGLDYLHIDVIIFGSPCTQLSSVNSVDRSGLEGPDSGLFYEALRILKTIHINKNGLPLYFLMENVASMSNKNRDKITNEFKNVFGESFQLLKINSSLLSGANRRRYYWTNIPNVIAPQEKNICFQDILVNGYADKIKANVLLSTDVTLTNGIFRYYKRNIGNVVFMNREFANLSVAKKLELYPSILNNSGYNGKSRVTLNNEYEFLNGCYRLLSVLEKERLMSFPDGYFSAVISICKTEKLKLIGLSFTVNVISHILSFLK